MITFSGTKTASSIIAIGVVLIATSVLAFAGENVTPDTIVRALQPKPLTRGLIAADKPDIDLEITFDYNSADISAASLPNVQALGKALSDPNLKGSTFVVAGHTDAVGGESYNQDLSERRADSIKRYLVDKYAIPSTDLVTVGYGKSKPKDPNAPVDPANRRVQVVNVANKTASK
jgi:outer membrane protein OmpA-like peptidoglycan-associated protein